MTRWLVLGLAACSQPLLPTSELTAQFDTALTASGGLEVIAKLMTDGGSEYFLVDDESLTATLGDEIKTLERIEPDPSATYIGLLDLPDEATTFGVTLVRPDDEVIISTASFPAPLVVAPLPTSAARSRDLTVTWTPPDANETAIATLSGDCMPVQGKLADDTGSMTFAAGSITSNTPASICQMRISLDIIALAPTLSPAFAGGHIATGLTQTLPPITSTP